MTLDELNAQFAADADVMLGHAKEWLEKAAKLIEAGTKAGHDEVLLAALFARQVKRLEKELEG